MAQAIIVKVPELLKIALDLERDGFLERAGFRTGQVVWRASEKKMPEAAHQLAVCEWEIVQLDGDNPAGRSPPMLTVPINVMFADRRGERAVHLRITSKSRISIAEPGTSPELLFGQMGAKRLLEGEED